MFGNRILAHEIHWLNYNEVCELFSSKSLSGNGQTLVYALCVVMPVSVVNLEVKGEDFGEQKRGQQLCHFPLNLSICCYGNHSAWCWSNRNCHPLSRAAVLCRAGRAGPRWQLGGAGPNSPGVPARSAERRPRLPGWGSGAQRTREKAVPRFPACPGLGSHLDPSSGPSPAQPRLHPPVRGCLSPAGAAGSRFGRISTEGR